MIEIKVEFPAFHRWTNAPEEVAFLRATHRHLFKCKLRFKVSHSDRDKEFFIMKGIIEGKLNEHYRNKNLGSKSCEMIAEEFLDMFDADWVYVSEDGENGAIVERINSCGCEK